MTYSFLMVSEEDKVGDSVIFFFSNLTKLAIFRACVCGGA